MTESGGIVTEALAGEVTIAINAAQTVSAVVLRVNGAYRSVPSGWTLANLLASLELDARTVVVERNGTILRDRSSFASLDLAASDVLEIVHFVGGG